MTAIYGGCESWTIPVYGGTMNGILQFYMLKSPAILQIGDKDYALLWFLRMAWPER